MTIDLTLSPIYRIGGQEIASLPGLVALTPPYAAARGREKDRLIAYLLLTGNATFSSSEYMQVVKDAANAFYQTTGAQTKALRVAAESANKFLLERNIATSKNSQYAIGWLTLAAVRENQCTLALSGPMHVYWFSHNETRHIHEPAVSGKGLGANQTTTIHYSQTSLDAGDRLLFFGRSPDTWKDVIEDRAPGSLDAMRRRLVANSNADLNAVLIQATEGTGVLNLLGTSNPAAEAVPATPPPQLAQPPAAESTPAVDSAPLPAHVVQPSAYAIPPQKKEETPPQQRAPGNTAPRDFPASIPRLQPGQTPPAPVEPAPPMMEELVETPSAETAAEPIKEQRPRPRRREYPEWTRQLAKALAGGIQLIRRVNTVTGERLKVFLPRLLPTAETGEALTLSNFAMASIAIVIPLIVVVVTVVVWSKYGQNPQYEIYLAQAREKSAQTASLTNPIEQRQSWEAVLTILDSAEGIYHPTSDTILLRQEANAKLDELFGITRLQFNPAFSSNPGIEISRMAAGETALFVLNAETGEALRAQPSPNGRGFQIDTTFTCKPGVYANYTVGALVDIMTLPPQNSNRAELLGIDATGNLLYCAPGQVAMAIPLPPPDTNWGRVTAFTLSNGNLYVLDAPARAVWVYNGMDGNFIDRPYFFFRDRTPEKQDVIDLVVFGDDLYMLHADSHLSSTTYSRIEVQKPRYEDPVPMKNPFPAYEGMDLFTGANFTQMLVTALPDQSILLLDADSQGVFRFSPNSMELKNQFRPVTGSANPIPSGPAGAFAIGLNHVLYLAVNGQVYFATNMP
ncbi:MAG: hypothetical protein HY865_06960 [Chloroflexi bacterium]|nr:hypothetical protein [Chloroflexota bacterium]